ncbi:glycosyltransferase family 2 protein [Sulfurospirillum sp. 'SP']|nr:glycosyltransferase family 2 protein [Sulfurospirillum sp. 'SP']WNY99521.1 glycosyltransferase family 2 protein [Sulfurospirillum sp. 'SP']
MEANNILSIVVPTYNRAEFLDYSLEVHIPMVREFGIEICIFDNASTDHTEEIVSKWMKEYPLLSYHKNETNLGPDANFEKALKYPQSEYVWLLGDTYQIQVDTFKKVVDIINLDQFDHILVNVGHEVKDVPSQIYQDQNQLLNDLFWLMTCLSVHIYKKSLITSANFGRFKNSNFIQTGIIFEYISNVEFKAYWCQEHSVERLSVLGRTKKDTWINNFFEIWLKNRINVIMALPPSYSLEIKLKSIRYDGYDRKQLTIKKLLHFRSMNLLNYAVYKEYEHILPLVVPYSKYIILLISLLPIKTYNFLRFFWRFLKRNQ